MDSPLEEVVSDQPSAEVYYPRDSTDATEVFDTLRQWLPSELALEILEQAGYWLRARVTRGDSTSYTEGNCHDRPPYLTSEPIQEHAPVREIRISIHSHDQGWSDHHEDHGTFRNSWTWFDLRVNRPQGDEVSDDEIVRLATNPHARSEPFHHELLYRGDRDDWVLRLQPGDLLCIVPRARFPGWRNYVEGASMEIYTTPVL